VPTLRAGFTAGIYGMIQVPPKNQTKMWLKMVKNLLATISYQQVVKRTFSN